MLSILRGILPVYLVCKLHKLFEQALLASTFANIVTHSFCVNFLSGVKRMLYGLKKNAEINMEIAAEILKREKFY